MISIQDLFLNFNSSSKKNNVHSSESGYKENKLNTLNTSFLNSTPALSQ